MQDNEPQPQGPEGLPDQEKESLGIKIDDATGRILASTVDTKFFLYPGHRIKPELNQQLKHEFLQKTPEDINYTPVNELLFDKREQYWAGDKRDFDTKNKDWNKEFWTGMEKGAREGENKEEFAAILKSVDIDITKGDTNADGLHEGLEKFRQDFIAKERQNFTIEPFIAKMAESCSENGNVDLDKLKQQLEILHDKGFMNAFGESDKEVDTLVEKYAMTHAVLSQKDGKIKDTIADAVVNRAGDYVPKDSQDRMLLEKLYARHKKLTGEPEEQQAKPGEETEPVQPSEEPEPAAAPAPITETSAEPKTESNKPESTTGLNPGDTLIDKSSNLEMTITNINKDANTITIRTSGGQEAAYPLDNIRQLVDNASFTRKPHEEPENTPSQATAPIESTEQSESAAAATPENPIIAQLTKGAEFTYMGTHGKIDTVAGDKVTVIFDDGSAHEIPLEKVQDPNRFTLIAKPDEPPAQA